MGGIAGFNEGSIHDIDCHDSKAVKVDAVTGNVGGIVGYQGSTGEIYQCTTGGKVGSDGEPWNIETINYQTDMAIGGVIGYNCSDKSVYSLTNRASVTKGGGNNEFNNSAGGIMGRLESSVSSSRKIYNCVNEGSITGNARVGGIIGQWKYKGGVLSNCTNKGLINANTLSGGIVGYILQLNDNEKVEISECRNEGNITTNSGGGILSTLGKKSNGIEIRLSQCVNTGDIKGTNIAGICWKQQHHSFNLLGCRNYGKGYSTDGKVNASFKGS